MAPLGPRPDAESMRMPVMTNIRTVLPADFPTIVCLCGSTRYWKTFRDEGLKLTLQGKIVLSIGISAAESVALAHFHTPEGIEVKRKLDELHFRKIELADEILILNVDGYIGESTRNEITHAKRIGKPIQYLVPIA